MNLNPYEPPRNDTPPKEAQQRDEVRWTYVETLFLLGFLALLALLLLS